MKKKPLDSFFKKMDVKRGETASEAKLRASRVFLTPISQAELACRIAEAALGQERPDGDTPEQAMDRMTDPARQQWLDAADACMGYLQECIMNSSQAN